MKPEMDREEMSLWQALAGRRTIRRFTPDPVDEGDLTRMLDAARLAPNGRNRQLWHFVVIKNRDVIQRMAEAVEMAATRLAARGREHGLDREAAKVEGEKMAWTLFARAPLTIAVFERPEPFDPRVAILQAEGLSGLEIQRFRPRSPLQSVAAAIENLLLAAHALGYGACWMTGPLIAAPELEEILGTGEELRLVALIPIGRPAESPPARPRKPLGEIVTVLA